MCNLWYKKSLYGIQNGWQIDINRCIKLFIYPHRNAYCGQIRMGRAGRIEQRLVVLTTDETEAKTKLLKAALDHLKDQTRSKLSAKRDSISEEMNYVNDAIAVLTAHLEETGNN